MDTVETPSVVSQTVHDTIIVTPSSPGSSPAQSRRSDDSSTNVSRNGRATQHEEDHTCTDPPSSGIGGSISDENFQTNSSMFSATIAPGA